MVVEGSYGRGLRGRGASAVAALALIAALAGCGGGDEEEKAARSEGVELAARLPSNDALNIAIADVKAIRKTLGMPPGAIPPTDSDDDDLVFLDVIGPALGVVSSGEFPQPVVDEALRRADWIAGVAGDKGVTAFATTGGSAGLEAMMMEAGLSEDDGEYVPEDNDFAIAIGDDVIAFADDPGDAKPAVEDDPGDSPEELDELDGEGELVTLARFGDSCVEAVATIDTPGEPGEIAFFTTATPDPSKITAEGLSTTGSRIHGDSARVTIPAAQDPIDEPPALLALQTFMVDYDCDGS